MSKRERIVLRPMRASDFEGEIDDLVDALREALPEVGAEVWDPLQRPPGSSPSDIAEILSVILPLAGSYAFDTVADIIVGRLRSTRAHDEEAPAAREVEIYGPSGEILKRVRIPSDDDDSTAD
jgi:hypothetical protein